MKIIIFFMIILTTSIGAYYYNNLNQPLVMIYPEEGPTKIKPQNAVELNLSGSNNIIYEHLQPQKKYTKTTKLVPEPEKPINLIKENKGNDLITDLINDLVTSKDKNLNLETKKDLNIIKIIDKNQDSIPVNFSNKNAYKIILGSVKSELIALSEGERIKKKYIKILIKTNITTKKIKDNNGNFFYLILGGDYKTAGQAKSICKKLSNNQQNCIITNDY